MAGAAVNFMSRSSSSLPQLAALSSLAQRLAIKAVAPQEQLGGLLLCMQRRCFHHERRPFRINTNDKDRVITKRKIVPEVFPSLNERLAELDEKVRDPELHAAVNIGLHRHSSESTVAVRKRQRAAVSALKSNKELCKQAREHTLRLDVAAIQRDWATEAAPAHITTLARHGGIYKDLFGPHAFFLPLVPLTPTHDYPGGEEVSIVYHGNIIKPREAATAPSVGWVSPEESLWTLVLSNPDGDLYKPDSECLHWMITNIRGSNVDSGTLVAPYLPPVPPRGLGYQRMVFVLYSQAEPITDTTHAPEDPNDLRQRSFSTEVFHRRHESCLTPAGIAWYNTDWDTSVTAVYHNKLGMKEPSFEYQFPKPYLAPQELGPVKKDFAFYMDMHRDKKDLQQDVLQKRLKTINPFEYEPPRLPFPSAVPIKNLMPSWRRQNIKRQRLGWGKFGEMFKPQNSEARLAEVQSKDSGSSTEVEKLLRKAAEIEVENMHMDRMGAEWKKVHLGKKMRARKAGDEETALAEQEAEELPKAEIADAAAKKTAM